MSQFKNNPDYNLTSREWQKGGTASEAPRRFAIVSAARPIVNKSRVRESVNLGMPNRQVGRLFVQRRQDTCLLSIATDIYPSPWIWLAGGCDVQVSDTTA